METKKCFKCGEVKPIENFYRHPMMADGRLGKCKECAKKDVKDHRMGNLKKIREYDRARSKTKKRKELAIVKQRERRVKHPEKDKAHRLINYDMRVGKIKKGPCLICGSEDNIHAHHPDYSKPREIIWLCKDCHFDAHFPERHEGEIHNR